MQKYIYKEERRPSSSGDHHVQQIIKGDVNLYNFFPDGLLNLLLSTGI